MFVFRSFHLKSCRDFVQTKSNCCRTPRILDAWEYCAGASPRGRKSPGNRNRRGNRIQLLQLQPGALCYAGNWVDLDQHLAAVLLYDTVQYCTGGTVPYYSIGCAATVLSGSDRCFVLRFPQTMSQSSASLDVSNGCVYRGTMVHSVALGNVQVSD